MALFGRRFRILLCPFVVLLANLVLMSVRGNVRGQALVPDYPISEIAVSGDGTRLAVLGRFEQISSDEWFYFVDILDASTLEIISSVEVGSRQPDMLNLSPDGRWVVYNVDYFELSAIDTLTGQKSVLFGRGPAEVGAVDWSPVDGRLAYSVGTATSISVFYGNFLGAHLYDEESPGLVTAIAWSSSGHELATKTYNRVDDTSTVQIWDETQINTGAIVDAPQRRFAANGWWLMWSPDDRLIASGNQGNVVLFDSDTGEQSLLSTDTLQNIAAMAWSPDGTQFAAGSTGIIWIWDVESRQIVDTIMVEGLVDAMVWLPTLGIVHNRYADEGLYQNGTLVTAPIVSTAATPTAAP